MASSSQNDRRREKMAARQRGAGTYKVQNAGFDFDLGELLATRATAPPPLPPPAAAPPAPPPPPPNPTTSQDPPASAQPPAPSEPPAPPPPPRRTSPRTNGTPEPGAKRRRQPSPDKFLNTPDKAEMHASQQQQARRINGDRAERMQQRMRGAGTQRVLDPGFDFGDIVQQAGWKRRKVSPAAGQEERREEAGTVGEVAMEEAPAVQPPPKPAPEPEPEIQQEPEPEIETEHDSTTELELGGHPMNFEPGSLEDPMSLDDSEGAPTIPDSRQTPEEEPRTPADSTKRKSLGTGGKRMPSPKISREEELEAQEAERRALMQAEEEAREEAEARRRAEEREREKARLKAEAAARAKAEAEEEAKAKAARAIARARAREKEMAELQPESEPEEDEEEGRQEEDQSVVIEEEERQQTPPRPKKHRPPNRSKPQDRVQPDEEYVEGSAAEEEEGGARQRRKGGIPVVVHRFAKSGDAPLPPKSNRKGPNPADIVFTLFSQLIDAAYGKLQNATEKTAVENFKEELASRLRQLTDTIENFVNLQTRIRAANRYKLQLQQELLEVRRQRNLVAAQKDEVRYNHEVASKQSEVLQRAGKTFEEVSGLVERGSAKDTPPDNTLVGLEATLLKVLPYVAGGGADGAGVLSKVVEFNRYMERLTEALREENKANGVA